MTSGSRPMVSGACEWAMAKGSNRSRSVSRMIPAKVVPPPGLLFARSGLKPVFRRIPGDGLPGRQQFRPALVGKIVKHFIQFDPLDRLVDGINDEAVSGLARALRRVGNARFHLFADVDRHRFHDRPPTAPVM